MGELGRWDSMHPVQGRVEPARCKIAGATLVNVVESRQAHHV